MKLATKNRVSAMWVPVDTNTKENDLADELVRQAPDMHFIEPEPFFGVSKHQLKKAGK